MSESELQIHSIYQTVSTHGTKVGSAVVGLYEGSVVGVNVGNKVGSDVGIN